MEITKWKPSRGIRKINKPESDQRAMTGTASGCEAEMREKSAHIISETYQVDCRKFCSTRSEL